MKKYEEMTSLELVAESNKLIKESNEMLYRNDDLLSNMAKSLDKIDIAINSDTKLLERCNDMIGLLTQGHNYGNAALEDLISDLNKRLNK